MAVENDELVIGIVNPDNEMPPVERVAQLPQELQDRLASSRSPEKNPHNYSERSVIIHKILFDYLGLAAARVATNPSFLPYDCEDWWQFMPQYKVTRVYILANEPVRAAKEKLFAKYLWDVEVFDPTENP